MGKKPLLDLGESLMNAFRASCMACLDNQYSNYGEKSVFIFDRSSTVEERERELVGVSESTEGLAPSLYHS